MTKVERSQRWRHALATTVFLLYAGTARAAVPFTPGNYYVLDLEAGALKQATGVADPARFDAIEYKTKKIVFRKISAGNFTMQADSGHQKVVNVPEYAIAIYPLTQGQYRMLSKRITLPPLRAQDFGEGDAKPAHYSCYNDYRNLAKSPTSLGSVLTPGGAVLTLPNEAQWEKAARAGTTGKWFFGVSDADLSLYGWCNDGGGKVREVGSKLPNQWGLYDVYGQVWEWCTDYWWGEWWTGAWWDAYNYQPGGYLGGDALSAHVLRGGSTAATSTECRSGSRRFDNPAVVAYNYGVRLILKPTGTSLATNLPVEAEPIAEDAWDDTTVYPAAEPAAGGCAPTFTIDRVQQHYPWDGKIDIHYTLSGVDSSRFHALYFTATGGGKSMTIFVKDRGGPSDPTGLKDESLARDGSHCYIWDVLETATNSTQCADDAAVTTLTNVFARGTARVTGRIVDTGAPVKVLRGDYKILDIASGVVTEMQNADPLQFNTDEYKTTKIAFRRIKARPSKNVDDDFYIAVFPLTMAQTRLLNGGTMPATYNWGWVVNTEVETVVKPDGTTEDVIHKRKEGTRVPCDPYKGDYWWQYQKGEHFPMNRISYNDVRGVMDNDVSQSTKGHIGTNEQGNASVFLAYSNMTHGVVLDFPDGFEWELAARGNTTYERWFFGDDDVNMGYYAWYWDNSLPYTCVKCLRPVGQRYPNQFGLWDVYGNVWEMCRNYRNSIRAEEWTPDYPSIRELRGGASYYRSWNASHYRPFPLTNEEEGKAGELFGGAYNWEGYGFYGFRPILVSHGN